MAGILRRARSFLPAPRRLLAGALVGLAAAAIIGAIDPLTKAITRAQDGPLDLLERKTYDRRLTRTARPEDASKDIVLIEIDEYSLRALQQRYGRWPWPRDAHADLIRYLSRGQPRLIVYDVNFAEPDTRCGARCEPGASGADADRQLVDAVRAAGNVVMLIDATYDRETEAPGVPMPSYDVGDAVYRRPGAYPPFDQLAGAAMALGHSLMVLDSDGPMRHAVPFVEHRGRAIPSLGAATAMAYLHIAPEQVTVDAHGLHLGPRLIPITRRVTEASTIPWTPIRFRGPALLDDRRTRPYASTSFYDVWRSARQFDAGDAPAVDPEMFRDRIVVVGTTASGLSDAFETPFSRGRMPGAQVHAAVIDDILADRFITQPSAASSTLVTVAAATVAGVFATTLATWWAAGATMVLAALFWSVATLAFGAGVWVNVTLPLTAGALALFGGVAEQHFVENRERRKLAGLFGLYVAPQVFERLVNDPTRARLGGELRYMTVLFSDIRGFTTVSQRQTPIETLALLNDHFTAMVEVIQRHGGMVDKFAGDMVMALFGAPMDDAAHEEHAVAAALEMCAAVDAVNTRRAAAGQPLVEIGVGINSGEMTAGNVGSPTIRSYTVVGDAVNLGSRLESLNKDLKSRVLISEATRRALPARFVCEPRGPVPVKGREGEVAIFEVHGVLPHGGGVVAPPAGTEVVI